MRIRWPRCFATILCIALLGSMAHARTLKKSSHKAELTVRRQLTVSTVVPGKHARKPPAKKSWRRGGQQVIDPQRVREIQAALIREEYLAGRANGVWDQRSKSAMARFQADNRWQSKVVPDSRALIKLGLGPDRTRLLNPDTADMGFIPGGGMPSSPRPSQR